MKRTKSDLRRGVANRARGAGGSNSSRAEVLSFVPPVHSWPLNSRRASYVRSSLISRSRVMIPSEPNDNGRYASPVFFRLLHRPSSSSSRGGFFLRAFPFSPAALIIPCLQSAELRAWEYKKMPSTGEQQTLCIPARIRTCFQRYITPIKHGVHYVHARREMHAALDARAKEARNGRHKQ